MRWGRVLRRSEARHAATITSRLPIVPDSVDGGAQHSTIPIRIKLRAKPFPKGVPGFSPAGVWGVPKFLFSSFLLFRLRRNGRKEGIFKGHCPLNRLT